MTLDVRGEVCPYPMLKAVEAMKKVRGKGESVIVLTDHAPCLETIPPQANKLGFSVEIKETGSPEWTINLIPKERT